MADGSSLSDVRGCTGMQGDYGTGAAEGVQSETERWGFPFVTEVRSGPGAAGGLAAAELGTSSVGTLSCRGKRRTRAEGA